MKEAQRAVIRQQELQQRELETQQAAEEERKKRDHAAQKQRDEQNRRRNEILQEVEQAKRLRAIQILRTLQDKGFKKVKKEQIKNLLNKPEKVNYDDVIEVYQGVLKKEREQIEEDKKKKMREVELWNRAIREEEKIAVEKYAQEKGDEDMKALKESMKAKQEKEAKDRAALVTASNAYQAYMKVQKD